MSIHRLEAIVRRPAALRFQSCDVVAAFHPIQNLKTGRIYGFEALARLRKGHAILPPGEFLPLLSASDLIALFGSMLASAVELLVGPLEGFPELTVSINVEYSVMMREEFYAAVKMVLAGRRRLGRRLIIELLEQEPIADRRKMHGVLQRLKRLGVTIALDDIGSAYSSLLMIKELPIDILKLDQAFARDLHKHPDSLLFVLNMMSLARSLGKILVVEGVETPDIHDALTILGVEYAQGYAIATPMRSEDVTAWMQAFALAKPQRRPRSPLGCYAAHLLFVEACQFCIKVPFNIHWTLKTNDPYLCAIGQFFEQQDLHDTPVGLAHRRFHEVLETYDPKSDVWQSASGDFRSELRHLMSGTART